MKRRVNQRGSVAIEFGLSFTALWFLFMGAFQFGYTFWLYNAASTQIADGARYAMRATYDTRNNNHRDWTRNMVVYGTPAPAANAVPVVPGLTTANVEVTFNPNNGVPDTVTVRIVNWSVNSVFNTFNFNGKPSVTMKYVGNYQTNV